MAVASVGMGALKATFQVLFDEVVAVKEETSTFEPLLEDIKTRLDSLKPLIEGIEKYNCPIELLQKLTMKMEEGVNIVKVCSKIGLWSCWRKSKYTNNLRALDKALGRLLKVLELQMLRDDVKETLKITLTSLRNAQTMLHQIQGSLVMLRQPEIVESWPAVPPEPPSFTVGLDAPLKEVKMKLLKDGVSMLVVTGPGGFGKTTLAKMFCHDQEVQDAFKNNILFLNIWKNPNLDLIVHQLYQWNGWDVLNFTNEEVAVRYLQRFLKETRQNPVLFVLDDVWSGSVSLLENFDRFKMSNYKILVTSRFEFRGFGSPYHLQPLNNEDASALFHHSASLEDKSSCAWEDISRKVVERCKGFPLAITVIGRALCGQPIEIWMKRVKDWSKGSSIFDTETTLLDSCQSSLDELDERDAILRECFIDLASFPEDQRIPAAALIDMWAELYELDIDALPIANLYELIKRNCASLVITKNESLEADGYYTDHFVTQHGILRELAIHQASKEPIEQRKRLLIDINKDKLPRWWTEQKYQPVKARLLSISTDGEFSAKWQDMQLPEAEVLVLNFQTKNYTLPEFVEKMDKLKVLIVTHCGHLPAEVDNFQLLGSLFNLKRIRLEQVSVPSISKNIKQLKSLQKISLFMCHIGQAFRKDSVQILAALPNLVEMNMDYCPDLAELPVELCDLNELKKLSITNCHKLAALPKEIGKIANLEVLRLRSCAKMSALPDSIRNLKQLKFLDISSCLSIKELPEHIGEMYSLEKVNMSQCSRLQELPPSVSNLENLKVVICDEETKDLWEPFLSFLRNIHIKVVKEDINLNWLQKLPS